MPRLNVDFNDQAYEVLEDLRNRTGRTKAELLRTALALLKIAYDEQEQGRALASVQGEDIRREYILPR